MKLLRNSITMRGDSLYCPLSLSLDSYGNCETDCHHCYLRNLNHVWGDELKPADTAALERKLVAGLRNKKPKTPLAYALAQKKTIRWGNKTDPFQKAEEKYQVAPEIFRILNKHYWSFVIQTKFTQVLMRYEKQLLESSAVGLVTVMPVISPGLDKDWEVFERSRTTPPEDRMKHLVQWMTRKVPAGVNGEPFIPGYHTVDDFEQTLKLLKAHRIPSYNTYNFHFNAFVAKRLHAIGVDIEKIWYYNQDKEWKKILSRLLRLSEKYEITLGCPDFVNSGKRWLEKANTCCGVTAINPCTFNTHYFKKYWQMGYTPDEIFELTWDGTGNPETGRAIIEGTTKEFYTLKDVK